MNEVLVRAIERAVKNGWEPPQSVMPYACYTQLNDYTGWLTIVEHPHLNDILFDKEFSAALWGKALWRKHLQNMVVDDDPVKYLWRNGI